MSDTFRAAAQTLLNLGTDIASLECEAFTPDGPVCGDDIGPCETCLLQNRFAERAESLRRALDAPTLPTLAVLDISTAHLTHDEVLALESAADWLREVILSYGSGFFISVNMLGDLDDSDDYPNLTACVEFARAHDFTWLRFDQDSDTIEELPSYEW